MAQITLNSTGVASSGSLVLQSNGTTSALTLDTAQNAGLGLTPSAWISSIKALQLNATGFVSSYSSGTNQNINIGSNSYVDSGAIDRYIVSTYATTYQQYQGQHKFFTAASGTAGNAITFTQAMTLAASGGLSVGSTTDAGTGNILVNGIFKSYAGTSAGQLNLGSNNYAIVYSDTTDLRLWTRDARPLTFYTNDAERARIDTSGNLLVGKTSASYTTLGAEIRATGQILSTMSGSTNSTETLNVYSTGAGVQRFYVGLGGTVYATSTSISAISDATLKENIRDLETGLTEVMALRPRRFDWKNGDAQNVAGFVAQEVEQVLPELVADYVYSKSEDGNNITKKSLKMGDILPTLVKAIQEQQAIIETLTNRITALEQA